eukprot:TRINITY_DN18193_c0_g1_i1.p3 TRINITY_DN18193_c0_g1~~TRINITY_DN18193_c0_g1_i1.p3  ORF type:complete len:118 (+),score=38.52 TRINITY_DN18193_c0_g1_i1:38-355(+)
MCIRDRDNVEESQNVFTDKFHEEIASFSFDIQNYLEWIKDKIVQPLEKPKQSEIQKQIAEKELLAQQMQEAAAAQQQKQKEDKSCLLYTSPSPRDRQKSRMPSSA